MLRSVRIQMSRDQLQLSVRPGKQVPKWAKAKVPFCEDGKGDKEQDYGGGPKLVQGDGGTDKVGGGGKGSFTYLQTTNFSQLIASLLSKTT